MANIDIDKDEILKTSKWLRFLFMALYAFAINIIIPIIIGLSFVQFLFYLFTSKPNSSIASFNSHSISGSRAPIIFPGRPKLQRLLVTLAQPTRT